jgi:hypothetical protein
MTDDQRGFKFLVGLAVLWLTWRYYVRGIWFAVIQYSIGTDICFGGDSVQSYAGPGAIVVAAVIEFVITVGWVSTLVASGIWDGFVLVGRFISDGFNVTHQYLKASQKPSVVPVPDKPAEVTAPVTNDLGFTPTGDPEKDAIMMLSQQVQYLDKQLKQMRGEPVGN